MASVGQKNTGAELLLRKALHRLGLRYRVHDRSKPGSPDLVFAHFNAVVFVHGCYWHWHECHRSTIPESRREFWTEKFTANRLRDKRNVDALRVAGWRVLTVWECALRGKTAIPASVVAQSVKTWLGSSQTVGEITGTSPTCSDMPSSSSPRVRRKSKRI
jgi:DNA mismatch endonuclease (patch repair protein)